jgi:exoribonuclease R
MASTMLARLPYDDDQFRQTAGVLGLRRSLKQRTITHHQTEIKEVRRLATGAIVHRLIHDYGWPIQAEYQYRNIAHYSLKAEIDRTTPVRPIDLWQNRRMRRLLQYPSPVPPIRRSDRQLRPFLWRRCTMGANTDLENTSEPSLTGDLGSATRQWRQSWMSLGG